MEMLKDNSARFTNIDGFMRYTSLGRSRAAEVGKEIGCAVKIGGRMLYDLKKADQYFDKMTGAE